MRGPTRLLLFCTSLRLIELKAIGLLSKVKHLSENDLVYLSGDEGDHLYIITRGAVEAPAAKYAPGTATTYLSRGDIFGETSALMASPATTPRAPAPR